VPTLFVHIPKTAGSSLNASAAEIFGTDQIECDYDASEPRTTKLVRRYIYGSTTVDQYGFKKAAEAAGVQWVTGHVSVERYLHLFGAASTISFVRDPVERVISEFQFLRRAGQIPDDLNAFYKQPDQTNKQFRMIGRQPWQAFHLVGNTRRYDECVSYLAHSLRLPLKPRQDNVRPPSDTATVSEEIRADILRWNERDALFVADVNNYLNGQLAAYKAGLPFCRYDHGFSADQHVIGWAFYAGNDEAVEVGLYVDGKLAECTRASEYREHLQTVDAPRMGHCGYRFVLTGYTGASHIEIRTQATGQTLFNWRRP